MDEKDCMLTTFDNSFNPFDDFEAWFKEDQRLNHKTCELLDSLTFTNYEVFSDEVNEDEVLRGMKEIVSRWPMIWKIFTRKDYQHQMA